MIYLTQCRTACTTEKKLIDDIPFPQHAHIIPNTFRRAKSGLKYPPHILLESLIDEKLRSYVIDNPVGVRLDSSLRRATKAG